MTEAEQLLESVDRAWRPPTLARDFTRFVHESDRELCDSLDDYWRRTRPWMSFYAGQLTLPV